MTRFAPWIAASALLVAWLPAPAARSESDETLTDIVNILRQEGLIDEDRHAELAAKAARKQDKKDWTDRISVWADFRARYEGFFYEQDVATRSAGERLHDRHRVRYRARINLSGEVNEYATVYLRLASGDDDPRTTNQTLGSGEDFDTDDVRFDLAYVTITPHPGGKLPGVENGYLGVDLGKVKNPFLWTDLGQDKLLWDADITLEGGSLRTKGSAGPLDLFVNGGVYVVDENSGTGLDAKDPKLAAAQLGTSSQLADAIRVGARGSIFHFFSLDEDFFDRSVNVFDGLARRQGSIQVVEGSAFLEITCWELFPILFHGSYAHNLSARSSITSSGLSRQNDAWAVGVLVGDETQLVRIGAGYYYIEANAFPSMFLDSDVLDGTPNRKGFAFTLERQLFENVALVLQAFKSRRIDGGAFHAATVPASDRVRARADLNFEF